MKLKFTFLNVLMLLIMGTKIYAQTAEPGWEISTFATPASTVAKIAIDQSNGDIYFTNSITGDGDNAPMYKYTLSKILTTYGPDWTGTNWHPYAATDIEFYNGKIYSNLPNQIVSFDPSDNTTNYLANITSDIETGSAIIGNILWTTDGITGDNLYKFDLSTNTLLATYTIIPNADNEGLEYCAATDKLYYASNIHPIREVYQDGSGTGIAIGTSVPAGGNFCIDPDGSFAYYLQGTTVLKVDLSDGTTTTFLSGLNSTVINDLEFGKSSDGVGVSLYVGGNSIIYEIRASQAPVPDIAILPTITDQCSVTLTAPTATDKDAVLITGTTTTAFPIITQGTTIVTWEYDDGNGSISTQNQTVIIDDVTAPATPTLATLTDECSVTATAPTTTDNCAGTITGTTTDPTEYTEQGTYTITWTFDDGNGNSTTAQQSIVVDDATAPVTPTLATLTDECSVTATAPTTTDNCAGTITGTTTDPTEYTEQGTYTITWTFDDGNGNSTTAQQSIVVDDATAPVTPTLATLTDECSVTAVAPTTTDNCAGTVTGTTSDPTEYTEQGSYTITWTFDDGNGNSTTAQQSVTVEDVTNPTISCIENQTIDLSGSASFYTVQETEFDPIADDNCEVSSIENDFNGLATLENAQLPRGTTTIKWTVTDIAGNAVFCSFDITVNSTVNISDFALKGISIYPNPTSGMINFDFSDFDIYKIAVSDITGKTLFVKTVSSQQDVVDISDYINGIYLITIQTDNGFFRTKVIKN